MKGGDILVSILSGVIGTAIVAVLLGQGSNTVGVLNAAFGGMAQLLQTIVSPVTGQSTTASGLTGTTYANTTPGNTLTANAANAALFFNSVLGQNGLSNAGGTTVSP